MFNDSLPEVLPLLSAQLSVRGEDISSRAVWSALSQDLLIAHKEPSPLQQLSPLETLQHLPARVGCVCVHAYLKNTTYLFVLVNACIIASERSGVDLRILRDVSRIAKLRARIGITCI